MEKVLKLFLFLIICNCLYADFPIKSFQEIRNQRLVRQTYEESCGASALATLINLLDQQNLTELDVLQKMSDKKELYTDMVSFADLEKTAQKLQYAAQSYRIDKNILQQLTLPILVKIEDDPRFPHFVIIINYQGDFITILDPSYGEYVSSKREFYSLWDAQGNGGYALILKPKNSTHTNYPLKLPNKNLFER